jgi:hypothetical protein
MDAVATELPPITYTKPTAESRLKTKQAYIHGKGSLRIVAEMHNLCHETVRNWAFREDWLGLRQEYEARTIQRMLGPEIPKPPLLPATTPQQNIVQATRIFKQLEAIEQQLDGLTKPNEIQALSNAHSKLFDTYATLTGIQRRSVQKPVKFRRGYQQAQPIEPDPVPAPEPTMPAQPMGWEYDG